MSKILISAIVASAQNGVIGKNNQLIWHIPEDLKHFRRTTMGKPVVMGRKSYESLGKPLAGRTNIVVSRTKNPEKPLDENGLFFVSSLEDAIALAKEKALQEKQTEIFIIGGAEIYRQTLDQIDRLYLTLLHQDYEGDAFFPPIDWPAWIITDEKPHKSNNPPFTFYTLERKR